MDLFGSLLELSQDVFYLYDGLNRKCTFINPLRASALGLENFSPFFGEHSEAEVFSSYSGGDESQIKTRRFPFTGSDGRVLSLEVREKIHRFHPDGTPWEILGSIRDITSFSNAEVREQHLKSLVSSLDQGLVEQDESGTIVYANPAAESILGLSLDQMRGRTSTDPRWQSIREDGTPFPGEDHPAMVTLRTGINQTGVVMGVRKPDGQLTWISINSTSIKTPSHIHKQKTIGVLASFTDITHRKNGDILRSLENRMAELTRTTPSELLTQWFVDQAERLSGSNIAFFQDLNPGPAGSPPTVWSENTVSHFCSAEHPETHHSPGKGGLWIVNGDRPLIHNDFPGLPGSRTLPPGHPPLFRELLVPVNDGSQIVGVLGVGNKRTDYLPEDGRLLMDFAASFRRFLQERRTYERLLQMEAGLESSLNGYAFANLDGVITYVNPAFLSLWGYDSVSQVYGRKASSFWSETEKADEVAGIVLAEGIWRGELTARSAQGTEKILDTFSQIIKDPRGTALGMMATFVDVTRSRLMAESARQLKHLESLGILAGGIAHDFNNLMGGIYGCIDMASVTQDQSQRQTYLTQALNTMGRARDLTRQLLTFSNGGEPQKTRSDLFKLARTVVDFTLSGTAVTPEFSFPEEVCPCYLDENQMSQVIRNLTLNALQAMPEGGRLKIRGIRQGGGNIPNPGANPDLILEMEDTGTGILPADLPKIFDPFFTTKETGTGLGLSTAYSIVRKHQGSITVSSVPGKGTIFRISLPASVRDGEPAEQEKVLPLQSPGRILILDDEKMLLQVCGAMVRELGYDPCCVSSCREALEEWKQALASGSPFQGAILDLTIPGEAGGVDTARQFRALSPDIPLFVSSGYSGDPVLAHPEEYGFTASLQKPYTMVQLSKVLKMT